MSRILGMILLSGELGLVSGCILPTPSDSGHRYFLKVNGSWVGELHSASFLDPGVPSDQGSHASIQLEFGSGMSTKFFDSLKVFVAGTAPRLSGAIFETDLSLKNTVQIDFQDALISTLTIPALDRGTTEAVYLSATLIPEASSSHAVATPGDLPVKSSTQLVGNWRADTFAIEVDRIDPATLHARQSQPVIFSQLIQDEVTGSGRGWIHSPSALKISPLLFSVTTAEAQALTDWFNQSVIAGSGTAADRGGAMQLVNILNQTALQLTFPQMHILKLEDSAGGMKTATLILESASLSTMTFLGPPSNL